MRWTRLPLGRAASAQLSTTPLSRLLPRARSRHRPHRRCQRSVFPVSALTIAPLTCDPVLSPNRRARPRRRRARPSRPPPRQARHRRLSPPNARQPPHPRTRARTRRAASHLARCGAHRRLVQSADPFADATCGSNPQKTVLSTNASLSRGRNSSSPGAANGRPRSATADRHGSFSVEPSAAPVAKGKDEDEDEEEEDDALYCLCQEKYDEDRIMLACDMCVSPLARHASHS